MPRRGAIGFVGDTSAAIRRLLHERPDAIATTTTSLARHGFGVGLLITATDAPTLAHLVRAAGAARPLTLALDSGGARFTAPPVHFLRRLALAHDRVLFACDARPDDLPAWPPAVLATAVLELNLAIAVRSGLTAHLNVSLDACPPSSAVAVLLTGVTPSRMPFARQLADFVLRNVRARDPLHRSRKVSVRVVATPDVASGPFEILVASRHSPARLVPATPLLPGVCAVVMVEPDTSSSLALSAWIGARPAALVVVVPRDAAAFAARAAVAAARARVPVRIVHASGRSISSAIRAAARAVPKGLALLVGEPGLNRASIHALGTLGTTMRGAILIPVRDNVEAGPIFIPADLRPALARVSGSTSARAWFEAHPNRVVHLQMGEDFR